MGLGSRGSILSAQPCPAFFSFPNPSAELGPSPALPELSVCTEIQVRSGSRRCKTAASPAALHSSQQTPVCMGCDAEKKKNKTTLMLVFLQQKFQLEMLWPPWGCKNPIQGGRYGMKRSREIVEGLWGAAGLVASRGQHSVPVSILVNP